MTTTNRIISKNNEQMFLRLLKGDTTLSDKWKLLPSTKYSLDNKSVFVRTKGVENAWLCYKKGGPPDTFKDQMTAELRIKRIQDLTEDGKYRAAVYYIDDFVFMRNGSNLGHGNFIIMNLKKSTIVRRMNLTKTLDYILIHSTPYKKLPLLVGVPFGKDELEMFDKLLKGEPNA